MRKKYKVFGEFTRTQLKMGILKVLKIELNFEQHLLFLVNSVTTTDCITIIINQKSDKLLVEYQVGVAFIDRGNTAMTTITIIAL